MDCKPKYVADFFMANLKRKNNPHFLIENRGNHDGKCERIY